MSTIRDHVRWATNLASQMRGLPWADGFEVVKFELPDEPEAVQEKITDWAMFGIPESARQRAMELS